MDCSFSYKPEHVCARKIDIVVEDGVIKNVRFEGGCSGNTQGVAALCIGRRVDEVVPLLEHIECRATREYKTSCPAQLAKALKSMDSLKADSN